MDLGQSFTYKDLEKRWEEARDRADSAKAHGDNGDHIAAKREECELAMLMTQVVEEHEADCDNVEYLREGYLPEEQDKDFTLTTYGVSYYMRKKQ